MGNHRVNPVEKPNDDTMGSPTGGCDGVESVFTDQCRQAAFEMIGAEVFKMTFSGHEFDHTDGLLDKKGCFAEV